MIEAQQIAKHFIDLSEIDTDTLRTILTFSKKTKADLKSGQKSSLPLLGKQIALVFEKPSTRTRVSFEAAMHQLGGNSIILDSQSSQLGRGESIADTARTLSRYVDLIMLRCFKHDTLLEMAEYATVPVINGLTDYSHPCQVLADILTFEEYRGTIEDKIIVWIGDCNNVANTWIQAAPKFDFTLRIACPEELSPPGNLPENVEVFRDPQKAAEGADLITTDTWVSMGDEDADTKRQLLQGFQVDDSVMSLAKDNAIFMHCLPAHRGEEVSASVIDSARSVVWDEAENRLHIQKALLLWCLNFIKDDGKIVNSKPFKGRKILLVEDNEMDIMVGRKIFEDFGCDVDTAHDGEEAINRTAEKTYDLIFMDCLMPIMNGFDATEAIRNRDKNNDKSIPIIAITGANMEADQKRGQKVGMSDFVHKPLTIEKSKDILTKWCSK